MFSFFLPIFFLESRFVVTHSSCCLICPRYDVLSIWIVRRSGLTFISSNTLSFVVLLVQLKRSILRYITILMLVDETYLLFGASKSRSHSSKGAICTWRVLSLVVMDNFILHRAFLISINPDLSLSICFFISVLRFKVLLISLLRYSNWFVLAILFPFILIGGPCGVAF